MRIQAATLQVFIPPARKSTKYLSLLKGLLPELKRTGVVESRNSLWSTVHEPFRQSCSSVGFEPIFAQIVDGDVNAPIDRLAPQRVELLVLRAEVVIYDQRFDPVAAAMTYS